MKRLSLWCFRSVFLFAVLLSGLCSNAQTQTYYITSPSQLTGMGNECSSSSYWGFGTEGGDPAQGCQWTDVIPSGSTITAVSIEFMVTYEYECGSTYTTALNGTSGGTSFSPTYCNYSCSSVDYTQTVSLPTSAYSIGGTNSFQVTGGFVWGWYAGLTGSSFAIVTVNYTSPTITVSGSLSNFGTECTNQVSGAQTYTVSGTSLTTAITITAPAGFLVSSGSGYASSAQVWPSSGTVYATPIYVEYSPTSVGGSSGNITNSSTGATTLNVAAAGTGIACPPTLSSTISSTNSSTSANLGGVISSVGSGNATTVGVYYSTSSFSPPGGTLVSQSGSFGVGNFSEVVTGLNPSTTYYFYAFATNSAGTTYSSEGTYRYNPNSNVFQATYTNASVYQADQWTSYVNGNKMILAGPGMAPGSVPVNAVTVTDTMGNLMNSYYYGTPGWGTIERLRYFNSTNSIISGVDGNTPPTSAFLGIFNHTTGTVSSDFGYNRYINNVRNGTGEASDAILLANGDLGMTGQMQETYNTSSWPSFFTAASGCPAGIGYPADDLYNGTAYQRGSDIFLIRTGANGDTATASGNDGYVMEWNLAYCGGGWTPAQPTPYNHTTGTFCYWDFTPPNNMIDSSRDEVGVSLVEDANHNIFICGYTVDHWSELIGGGNPADKEAFVLKTNSAGAVQWCKTYYISNQASANQMAVGIAAVNIADASNDVIIIMESQSTGAVEIARLANATGNIVWANSIAFGTNYVFPWSLKQTTQGNFIIGVELTPNLLNGTCCGSVSTNSNSYDMAFLEVNSSGTVLKASGYGTPNMDGEDGSFGGDIGPQVDQLGSGSNFVISGVTRYSGGFGPGNYTVKINGLSMSSGCSSSEQYSISTSNTPRTLAGGNQLNSRTPIVYQFRQGANKVTVSPTVAPVQLTPEVLCASSALPIELLSFTAQPENNSYVKLNWVTATETNNNFFTVERSQDGIEFEDLNTVKGSGTTSVKHSYESFDYAPYKGISYYRIKQTDYDGKYTYSDIQSVNFSTPGSLFVSRIPSSGDYLLDFQTSSSETDNYTITVYNALGQLISTETLYSFAGTYSKNYNLLTHGAGVYLFTVTGSRDNIVRRVVAY